MMTNVSKKKFYAFFLMVFLLVYYLSLRFVFPGYFSPFVPHHSDMLDYPYDLIRGGTQMLGSRPAGLVLTWLFGLWFSWKGVIVSAIACTFVSMALITEIISQETGIYPRSWNLIAYTILVLIAPTFYINYSFDIYGTYALTIGLIAVRLTYSNQLKKRPSILFLLYFTIMLLGFLSKETYIVSFCFFFFAKAILDREDRRRSIGLLFLTGLAGIASLLYGKMMGSAFVASTAGENSPYYVSLAPISLIKCFLFYAKGLVNIPLLLVILISAVFAIRSKKKGNIIAFLFCLSGLFAYAPYCVLPNKLVPHYVFVAVPMLMGAVYFIEFSAAFREKWLDWLIGTVFCAAIMFSYTKWDAAHSYAAMSGWVKTETGMRISLASMKQVRQEVQPNEKVLVLGLENYTENFYRASFAVDDYLPDGAHFDVHNAHPEFCGVISDKVTYIPFYNNIEEYDKVIVYSEEAYEILDRESEKLAQYQAEVFEMPVLSESDIFPGVNISRGDQNENGEIAIAVILSDVHEDLKIMVDGKIMSTCYADDFISTALTHEILENDSAEVCVIEMISGRISNSVTLQFTD